MTSRLKSFSLAILVLLIAAMITIPAAYAQVEDSFGEKGGTPTITAVPRSMNYQGILKDSGGNPLPNTTVNVTFRIFDDEFIGTMEWDQNVGITTDDDGMFATTLDNLNIPFDEDYWFELQVIGDPSPMLPRQKINMSAYAAVADTSDFASHSITSDNATHSVTSDAAAFSDSTDAITDGAIDFADIGQNGAISGQVMKWNGSAWSVANDETGTSSGWADDGTVVRLETSSDSVGIGTATPTEKLEVSGNILVTGKATIGPGHTNTGIYAFVAGSNNAARGGYSVVAGGGGATAADSNLASGDYSAIGGGYGNIASSFSASIGGGNGNTANNYNSTVSGGQVNTASGNSASVGGGYQNTASGNVASVGGGYTNIASGTRSVVGGGTSNIANGDYSSVTGGASNNASGRYSSLGGGASNLTNGLSSTIAGGEYDTTHATYGGVAAGYSNLAGDYYSDTAAFVGGGYDNSATGKYSTVGGGKTNTASNLGSTVGGGSNNSASGQNSLVGGGYSDTASGNSAAVSGGSQNVANQSFAAIGGGYQNTASGYYSYVGGGDNNTASDFYAAVSGGTVNSASGNAAFVGGGKQNNASGIQSSIGGGYQNSVSGDYSSIPGGNGNNVSGSISMAFGYHGNLATGSRVAFFNGSFSGKFGINRDDNSGGISYPIHVGTSTSNGNGAYLTTGGVWTNTSSKTSKENFQRLDREQLLSAIESLPVESWNYKNSDEKHIGPYAEDFVAAFDVGVIRESDGQRENKALAAGDVAGVALAGVKVLIEKIEALEKEIAELKANR